MPQNAKTHDRYLIYIDQDFSDIVPEFIDSVYENIKEIETALNEKDMESICRIGHNLKGTGGGYGFEQLSTFGSAIEESGKIADINAVSQLVSEISDYLSKIKIQYIDR
ncbi:Hpt protein [Chloroherpeton thalassium ATCC 35110]|uniref:Hpt protein n=1 Tax=Chloroherpeton thalassium (strain ATCC 35110 / GB-78) TaxID=517418 RepID=B3QXP0_CHLT3|nr:Hpt domain-containing protein [Chloroherpeton thalassium]ACF14955.1 Hpt protein [Chloroherpeton thalassium ATCC 35110]